MPIYEFTCSACDHEFEVLVRGTEQPECPKCGDEKLNRKLSVPAAHTSTNSLPIHNHSPKGCGLPGCGTGACQMGGAM
jgi:putative FmdB family regulatory protein